MNPSFQFQPRTQMGGTLPAIRAVNDYTQFILSNSKHLKLNQMINGKWYQWNTTPEDELRILKLGVGLLDSEPITYDITLKDAGNFSHLGYETGNYKFDGRGYYLDYNNSYSDKSYLVVDNLVVRDALTVYDFLVMQKRFSAGSLAVTPGGGKVSAVNGTTITFEDPSALGVCSFAANDILITKAVSPDKGTVLRSVEATVSSVSGNDVVVSYTSGTFQAGDEVVCVGNTSDSARQGGVYISSDDDDTPFIDVFSGVNSLAAWSSTNKVKARFGNLAGYTSAVHGALSGFGVFIKDNFYIDDGFIALSSSGFVRAGKANYSDATAGFFLGYDSGTPKINFGDSSEFLTWDGSNLTITGSMTILNPEDINASDINNDKGWIRTTYSGTEPASPDTGDLWCDTSDGNRMYRWSGSAWELYLPGFMASPTGSGLFLSSTYMGYYTSGAFTTYMDNSGNFALGNVGGGGAGISWTQGTSTLSIKGSINITNPTTAFNGSNLSIDDVADGSNYKRVASTDIDAGHITVVSSSASININSTTYGNQGIQLQYNGGTPRMYAGDGANQYFKFDGTNISWKGTNSSLTAAGAFSASNATISGSVTLTNTTTFANGSALSLDDVANGSTYGRVLATSINAGKIILAEAVGDLDDIADGTGYGKVLKTDISGGHILLSEGIGDLDDIADGTTYAKVASTDITAGHITLVASTASININSTTFGNAGIQLQYNSGSPRMYVGNGSTKYMKFDGTDVSIGNGTITGGIVQTATSGQRIVISGSSNTIDFYAATGFGGTITATAANSLTFDTDLLGTAYFVGNVEVGGNLSVTGSLSGYTPTTRTLTINGTSYDLSANRSWTVSSSVDQTANYSWTGTHTWSKAVSGSYYLTLTNTETSNTSALAGFYMKSNQAGSASGAAFQVFSSQYSDASIAGYARLRSDLALNGLILDTGASDEISFRINGSEYGKINSSGLTTSALTFSSGNDAAPSNTTTPVAWKTIITSAGTYKIPLYQ